MPRANSTVPRHKRHRKIIKQAKGYFGTRKSNYRTAKDAVQKAGQYAYRDRRKKKGEFRSLWIIRINAAARLCDISYSKFMHGLKVANINIDRKVLADIAVNDSDAFKALAEKAKLALEKL